MFGGNLERVRGLFADQFTPDGEDYLYRKNMQGAAIRVTAAERNQFVAQFNRSLRRLFIAFAVFATVVIAAFVTVAVNLESEPGDWATYACIAVVLAPVPLGLLHLWYAPARALAARSAVAPALTREQAKAEGLKRMTWGQLAAAAMVLPLLLYQVGKDYDLLYGWNRLWLLGLAVYAGLLLFRVYQLWRRDHS